MLKTINALSVVMVLIIFGFSGFAQNNNTTSPFSRYGIGDLNHYGYGRSAAMGGASLGSRNSLQINSANPASYNAVDSLSFLFEFGLDGTFAKYKSNLGTQNAKDINFRYFSLNFPVTRWLGAGLGVQPFSDMGYQVNYTENVSGAGLVAFNYLGEGSTSKAYFGAAIKPFKNLSIGANLNYLFGRINRNTTVSFANPDYFYQSITEGTRLRDFTLTYGLQYSVNLKKDESITLGVTFENKANLLVLHQLYSLLTISDGTNTLTDSLPSFSEKRTHILLPSKLGVGLSYHKLNKLEINADYYHAGWSDSKTSLVYDPILKNSISQNDPLLTNQNRISAGLEYIPEAFSIRSKLKRIKYRAGFHQENSYLKLNNQQIKEIGISFGAGIPFPKSNSTANFAFEFGKKGTTNYNLVKENYMKVSLYLNLFDYWFMKHKFD